jgi:large repetitive protein
MLLQSDSVGITQSKRLIVLFVLGASFLFVGLISSPHANAAETIVTGKVSALTNFDSGFVWAETQVNGNWRFISGANKELKNDGNFSIDLEGLSGETVRIAVYAKLTSGSYVKLGDSFTLATGTTTKNLTLDSLNVKINLTPAIACFGSNFSLEQNAWDTAKWLWFPFMVPSGGVINLSLPSGVSYVFNGNCNGDMPYTSSFTSSGSLQTINVSAGTANISGTVSNITSSDDVIGMIQAKETPWGEVFTDWQDVWEVKVTSEGRYAAKIPAGTYRVKFNPQVTQAMTEYVTTYTDSFILTDSAVTKNVNLSKVANVVYTVNPKEISPGSYVNVVSSTASIKGKSIQTEAQTLVRADGKIRLYLETGTYRLQISPNQNRAGYVYSVSPEFTVTDIGATLNAELTLRQANLTISINSGAYTQGGYVSACTTDGEKCFDGEIGSDGFARVYAEAGTYQVSIEPSFKKVTATSTRVNNFVVTGTSQEVNWNLAAANITGNISPATKSASGWINFRQKITSPKGIRWTYAGWAQVDTKGNYFGSLPEGTFKIRVSPDWQNPFIVTTSDEFVVGSTPIEKNLTIATPNVSGTIYPLDKSLGGWIEVQLIGETQWQEEYEDNYYATIAQDGKYELSLPPGTYRLRASPGKPGVYPTKSTEFTVAETLVTKDITLAAANITGTVSPIAKSRHAWADVQKIINGQWQYSNDGFSVQADGTYSAYLEPGTYRVNFTPSWGTKGVGKLLTGSITTTDTLQTLDFTLPSTNFKAQLTPASIGANAYVHIFKVSDEKSNEEYVDGVQTNGDGQIESYLPSGKYKLFIHPFTRDFAQTWTDVFTMPDTSTLTTFTFAVNTPNVSGVIKPLGYGVWSQVCLEQKRNERWEGYRYCTQSDREDKFSFKVEDGTYRPVVVPQGYLDEKTGNWSDSTPYVVTTGSEFTITGNSAALEVTLSTGNVKGTVSPGVRAANGHVYAVRTSGSQFEWLNAWSEVDSEGKYAMQLPAGTYRLRVEIPQGANDYVRTETADFVVGTTDITKNIILDTPNIVGTVTPVEKSAGGWIHAEQFSCKCGWSGWSAAPSFANSSAISKTGTYGIKVPEGLTRLVAYPSWDSTGVVRTYSNSFTATANQQTVDITLSSGNVSGSVSSLANAAGGWISIQRYNEWGWSWGDSTNIKADGSYNFDVPTGDYRIVANPGWQSTGVVETVSETFSAVEGTPMTKNITLLAANVTGTVTNLAAKVDETKLSRYGTSNKRFINVAWGNVYKKSGSNWIWDSRNVQIQGDGTYSIYLPAGEYKIYMNDTSDLVTGLVDGYTEEFTVVNGVNKVFNFAMRESNVSGTITPTSSSNYGWVCPQKLEAVKNYWYGSGRCANVRSDGTYELNLEAGTYRLEANPYWYSQGHARTTSTTFTVATEKTVVDIVLNTTNTKLRILDSSGNPNHQGWINVKDSAGNYVDTQKTGWISELGKVDFRLTPGTYTLEIQPGNYATGVRTVTTITVPEDGIETTISLVDGNIQGTALSSTGTKLVCAFVTATATGKTTVRSLTKSNGTFSLDLEAGPEEGPAVVWTISVTDPASGETKSSMITPGRTSINPITITTAAP